MESLLRSTGSFTKFLVSLLWWSSFLFCYFKLHVILFIRSKKKNKNTIYSNHERMRYYNFYGIDFGFKTFFDAVGISIILSASFSSYY